MYRKQIQKKSVNILLNLSSSMDCEEHCGIRKKLEMYIMLLNCFLSLEYKGALHHKDGQLLF